MAVASATDRRDALPILQFQNIACRGCQAFGGAILLSDFSKELAVVAKDGLIVSRVVVGFEKIDGEVLPVLGFDQALPNIGPFVAVPPNHTGYELLEIR